MLVELCTLYRMLEGSGISFRLTDSREPCVRMSWDSEKTTGRLSDLKDNRTRNRARPQLAALLEANPQIAKQLDGLLERLALARVQRCEGRELRSPGPRAYRV